MINQTSTTNTHFADSVINTRIDRAQEDFARRTKMLRTEDSITTVANTFKYDMSTLIATNFISLDHVRYVDDATNDVGDILRPFPGGYRNLPKSKQFGTPSFYVHRFPHTRLTAEFIAWPIPDTSSKTITMQGAYAPAALADDSAVSTIPVIYHDAMAYHAAYMLLSVHMRRSGLDVNKVQWMKNEYLEIIEQASFEDARDTNDEPDQVIDVYSSGGYGYF